MSEFKTPTDPVTDKALTQEDLVVKEELKKEFNLSEKCYTLEAPQLKISGIIYQEEDVKEFIRLLKEEFKGKQFYNKNEDIWKKINKLAGSNLTELEGGN